MPFGCSALTPHPYARGRHPPRRHPRPNRRRERLVATLLADDHPHGPEAAARIAHALDVDAACWKASSRRDAELRGSLARDLLERKTRPSLDH